MKDDLRPVVREQAKLLSRLGEMNRALYADLHAAREELKKLRPPKPVETNGKRR